MIIEQGSTPESVFLLVRERDAITGIEDAQNMKCAWSQPRGEFIPIGESGIYEIGNGWYSVRLPAAATAKKGPLIFVAESDDSYQWRDIHQVVVPVEQSESGGCSCDEIATMIDEALATPPAQEVDTDALIDMVAEALTVELVRRDVGISPDPPIEPPIEPPVEPPVPAPNLVPAIGEWSLHCGGEIVRTVTGDAAEFRRQGANSSNCQTYTVLPVEPGPYRLTFTARANPSTSIVIALHQHGAPYADLAESVEVAINDLGHGAHVALDVAEAHDGARLRFWLGGLGDGGELWIDDVRFWKM